MRNEINLNEYTDKLVGRIYKILPLIESDKDNAKKYLNNLLVELNGANKYFDNINFTRIIFSLEGMKNITDYNIVRSKIFECINLVNKIKKIQKEVK